MVNCDNYLPNNAMLIKYVSLYHRCVFLAQKYQEFNTKIYNMFYHLQYNTLLVMATADMC